MLDPTQRFSSRVGNYVKYRPSYPHAVVAVLMKEWGLTRSSVIADLGSGTGILSKLFLDNGNRVFGVEPNHEMREAGERLLRDYANFVSVNGTAEATTLAGGSMDGVTAGQAFHWFDIPKTRVECQRILKPSGWVALVWNSRKIDSTPFLRDYEQLLRDHSDDYAAVNHQDAVTPAAITSFFGGEPRKTMFDNQQLFDFGGLRGRLLSSSYAPDGSHPNHEAMLRELCTLFDRHQTNGRVAFLYHTEMLYGQIK